jgi:hypothetical protein
MMSEFASSVDGVGLRCRDVQPPGGAHQTVPGKDCDDLL